MNNIIRNKKGFTMVELLATVVILGILSVTAIVAVSRIIASSKDAKEKQQKNSLEMAAKSYLEINRDKLPKEIGEERIVYAYELKDTNFLKEQIKDRSGKDCTGSSSTKKSYVQVRKESKTEYTYTATLYCESGATPSPEDSEVPTPKINIDVSNNNIIIDISGSDNPSTPSPIQGYSYYILKDNKEIYNSGTLSANKKENIRIEKKISDCINITTPTIITIKATARNVKGGYNTATFPEVTIEN